MSKFLTAGSLVLAVGATAGVVFSSVQLRQASDQIEKLEGRLAGLERSLPASAGPGVSAKAAAGGTDAPAADAGSERIETLGDTIREVKRLREEVDAAKEKAATPAGLNETPSTGSRISGDEEAMKKVVEDVLAAKERERVEGEKKRAQDWAKARLDKQVADLAEKCQLSAQQRDQVAEILGKASNAQMEIWANRKEGENPWQKVQDLRKETDAQVKQFLTAEQQLRYDEYMKTQGGPRVMIESNTGGQPGAVVPAPGK